MTVAGARSILPFDIFTLFQVDFLTIPERACAQPQMGFGKLGAKKGAILKTTKEPVYSLIFTAFRKHLSGFTVND